MKIISDLKKFITGTSDEAKAVVDELATIEKAYAEAAADLQGFEAAKLGHDVEAARFEAKQPTESRAEYARRLWELQGARKAIVDKIDAASATLKALQVERTRLSAERSRASGAAVLAKGSPDGAQALAQLDSARRTVQTLEAKAVDAKATGERLASERAEIALAAHSGDTAAATRLDEINKRIVMHGVETDGLTAAIEQAKRNVHGAEAIVAGQDRAFRQAEAERIGSLILEQSAIVDAALANAVAALHRRRELAIDLKKTGIISSGMTNQLGSPMTLNRALAAAGLGDFARIDRGGRATPLAEHDVKIVGHPTAPARAA